MNCQKPPNKAAYGNLPKISKEQRYIHRSLKNKYPMEVIAIKKAVLDDMTNELKELLDFTENATQKYTLIFKKEIWLDNQGVCMMLNITKRTLQNYKNKGLLSYSKLNRKNYFKRSDVQALFDAGQSHNTNGFIDE